MTYDEFLGLLQPHSEEKFAAFQKKLILPPTAKILGVRTPVMRAIAKSVLTHVDELLSFPDEYYEVTFIKLTAVSLLPYEEFINRLDGCVRLIDNWALCDSFKVSCIKKHKEEFLPKVEGLFSTGKEFYQRYALVTLLTYYCEEKYLPVIKGYLQRSKTEFYYVKMAAAWLLAEVLVKHYERGVQWLNEGLLDAATRDKAIQKAKESFRIDKAKKEFLTSLKNKKRER